MRVRGGHDSPDKTVDCQLLTARPHSWSGSGCSPNFLASFTTTLHSVTIGDSFTTTLHSVTTGDSFTTTLHSVTIGDSYTTTLHSVTTGAVTKLGPMNLCHHHPPFTPQCTESYTASRPSQHSDHSPLISSTGLSLAQSLHIH